MKKSIKWVSLLIILAIAIYFIFPNIFGFDKADEKIEEEVSSGNGGGGIPVSAIIIKPRKLEDKINVTGSVIANEAIELKSETSGIIEKIYFKEGSRVRKGQLLLSLEDDELIAQQEKLRYQKKLLEESEYRQRQLLDREAISQEEYDIALTELNSAEADLKLISAQIAKTKIKAPFDGIIGLRYVSEGSYITPNEIIASLMNIDLVKIDFSIPGKYSNRVSVNDKIRFQTESLNESLEADIYAIEPQVDPSTRTLQMRAICPNPDQKIFPGQFAKIALIFQTYDDAILVPTEAVIPELGGHKVYVNENGKAVTRQVKVGIRTESDVEIISGLSPQDTLITSGVLQLNPGADVSLSILN